MPNSGVDGVTDRESCGYRVHHDMGQPHSWLPQRGLDL